MDDELLIKIYTWITIAIVLYVSGWLMFLQPILTVLNCDVISGGLLVSTILKIFFAAPVGKIISRFSIIIAIKIFG